MKKLTKKNNSLEKDVERLLRIVNQQGSIKEILKLVAEKTFPTSKIISEKTLALFMTDENIESLYQITKEIYLKNYTQKEVNSMIKFYGSKDGKSILKKMSLVATEIAIASRDWSLRIINESKDKIEAMIEEQVDLELKQRETKAENSEKTANKRYDFSQKYITEKGWDSKNLSDEQLNEIRNQKDWKNPK